MHRPAVCPHNSFEEDFEGAVMSGPLSTGAEGGILLLTTAGQPYNGTPRSVSTPRSCIAHARGALSLDQCTGVGDMPCMLSCSSSQWEGCVGDKPCPGHPQLTRGAMPSVYHKALPYLQQTLCPASAKWCKHCLHPKHIHVSGRPMNSCYPNTMDYLTLRPAVQPLVCCMMDKFWFFFEHACALAAL